MKLLQEGYKSLNVGCGEDVRCSDRIDIVKTKTTTKVYDIEKGLPYEDNTFDEILCQYVYEHMKNPHALLVEMKRVLKEKGKIGVITDNAGYLLNHVKFRTYHGDYLENGRTDDKHYFLYTPEHLRNHFQTAGLSIEGYGYKFWDDVHGKSKIFHRAMAKIISERFFMPSVVIVGGK